MGLLNSSIPFSLLNWGKLYVSSGFAGITMAVVPLLVLTLSHFILKSNKMVHRKIFVFIIGFIDIIVFIYTTQLIINNSASLAPIDRIA